MFSHCVKIAYFCLVSTLIAATEVDIAGRIIGGQNTTIDMVPYLVQIRERTSDSFFCGGTMVTKRHVVTAAHCVDAATRPSNIIVVGGASTISEAGVQRTVAKAIKHPRYNKGKEINNDVAVLVLSSPMSGPIIHTIALPTQGVSAGEIIQVSGWGITAENATSASDQVRTVLVPIVPTDQCISQYGSSKISESMFCASVPGTKDSCAGDSGGPAIADNKLVGIVSWGIGCARPDFPGVYTNVFVVLPFIKECLKL